MKINIAANTLVDLQKGESKAFETVYKAYFDKVKRFITSITRSPDDAEDMAQDIFLKLWTERETLNMEMSFNSFLFTVARNAAFNFLKHKLVEESYINEYCREIDTDTPEEHAFAGDIELLVEMALERMPAKRSEVYRLSRQTGLENDEIALQLGISRHTVENNLSLALKEIRRMLLIS